MILSLDPFTQAKSCLAVLAMSISGKRVVAVVGSRPANHSDDLVIKQKVINVMTHLTRRDYVVSGGCRTGADYWAKKACIASDIPYIEVPANWRPGDGAKYDPLAGLRRNTVIADLCTHCIAIWDGKSRGTLDTMTKVQALGKPLWVVPLAQVVKI